MTFLCRLCLKTSKFRFSLFTGNILEKVETLTCIKMEANDKLPKTCCEACVANVYNSYNFQQLIIASNKVLQEQCANELQVIEHAKLLPDLYEVLVEVQEDTSDDGALVEPKEEIEENDVTDYLNIVCKSEVDEKEIYQDLEEDAAQVGELESKQELETLLYEVASPVLREVKTHSRPNKKEKCKSRVALKCQDCELTFRTRLLLQRHRVKHKIEKCPYCAITMRRDNLKRHIQIHTDTPEVCEICGMVAKNKESLRGHMNYQHKSNSVVRCDSCKRSFKSNHHYKAHYRKIHLNIRNIQCHLCGKKFYANHDMNKHINMTHKGARPHICQYCHRGFSSPYALKTHIRQHTLETPYRCTVCPTNFRQKVSLVTHMKSKHGHHTNNLKVELEEIIVNA